LSDFYVSNAIITTIIKTPESPDLSASEAISLSLQLSYISSLCVSNFHILNSYILICGSQKYAFAAIMPPKISRQTKTEALKLVEIGFSKTNAAKVLGISTKTITRADRKYQKTGDIEGGREIRGPKPKVTDEMRMVCS
jgi:hypothetical protein